MASLEDRSKHDSSRSATFRVIWKENGRRKTETFSTRQQAIAFKTLVEANGNRTPEGWQLGKGYTERPSFRQVTEDFLQHRAEIKKIQPDTLRDYRSLIARAWLPLWGHLPIESITTEDLENWQKAHANGRSHKTLMEARGLLFSIFKFAVQRELLPGNPMSRVETPVQERLERTSVTGVHYFTVPQLAAIRSHLCPVATDLVDVAYFTGMRWGEYTALRVSDLHLADEWPHITVLRAWKRGRKTTGPTKTDAGFRNVYLPEDAVELLHRLTNGRSGDEHVLLNGDGNPWKSSAFHKSHWHRAVAEARKELPLPEKSQIRMLRHTYVVHMMTAGMPLTVLQRQVGHKSIIVTNNTYGGIVDAERGRQAMEYGSVLGNLYRSA